MRQKRKNRGSLLIYALEIFALLLFVDAFFISLNLVDIARLQRLKAKTQADILSHAGLAYARYFFKKQDPPLRAKISVFIPNTQNRFEFSFMEYEGRRAISCRGVTFFQSKRIYGQNFMEVDKKQ
jgi:phosphoglucomutase